MLKDLSLAYGTAARVMTSTVGTAGVLSDKLVSGEVLTGDRGIQEIIGGRRDWGPNRSAVTGTVPYLP